MLGKQSLYTDVPFQKSIFGTLQASMRTSVKIGLVIFAAILPSIAVLRNARTHAPVMDGTAAEFWLFACAVEVSGAKDRLVLGGIYPPKDDWAIYYHQGYHDQFLYRVQLSEVAPLLPEVINRLQMQKQQGDLHSVLEQVLESGVDHGIEPRRFLELIRKTRLELAQKEGQDQYSYLIESERSFDERWKRAQVYWRTLAFESLWLGALVAFAGIPWICRSSRFRWANHLALTPFLLFLPHFCGYVPYAFTSAFPAGGVFYPYVLRWFRFLPWTGLDTWLSQFAPRFFEPLTQHPGPMLAVTGMGGVGPVAACVLGGVTGLLVFGAGAALRRLYPVIAARSPESKSSLG